jgi:hypothetical protein
MHASRTHFALRGEWRTAEEHVRIYPRVGNNTAKAMLIPHTSRLLVGESRKAREDERAAHQVVGGVMAHQADDG